MFRFLILRISTIKNKNLLDGALISNSLSCFSEIFNVLKKKIIKKIDRLKNNLIYAKAAKVLRYLNLEMFTFWLGKSNFFGRIFEFLQPDKCDFNT